MTQIKSTHTDIEATPLARIVVADHGPYLLYGQLPFTQQIITPDAMGESWSYTRGDDYPTNPDPTQPTALCRCGRSHHAPYCDHSHQKAKWDDRLTARPDKIVDDAIFIEGEGVRLSDNERYCCYARFCHPAGGAWRLASNSSTQANRDMAIREATMCPSARLMAWKRDGEMPHEAPYEFDFEPSIALLEDPQAECSAGLWLRGGISVERADGVRYEVRNRVVLCRCGQSHNKPYCDGTHAATQWSDSLPISTSDEELPDGQIAIV